MSESAEKVIVVDAKKQGLSLKLAIICVIGTVGLGSVSGYFGMGDSMEWYESLKRPPGVPPNWTFGIVWTILYALMGLALALIMSAKARKGKKAKAVLFFAIQFALNLTWSPIFFGAQLMLPALVIIVAMLLLILLTIRHFYPISRTAAFLLVPYLAWVSYATYLNAGFVFLN